MFPVLGARCSIRTESYFVILHVFIFIIEFGAILGAIRPHVRDFPVRHQGLSAVVVPPASGICKLVFTLTQQNIKPLGTNQYTYIRLPGGGDRLRRKNGRRSSSFKSWIAIE